MFTPGGDLIYGIDSSKQAHWHIHLCLSLQQILGLPEPPHFLVPGYTATVDRWLEGRTQQIVTAAEIYPPVQRYHSLLTVLFELDRVVWQVVPWQEEYCHPLILETYRQQFPQLWENHDLIVRVDPPLDDRVEKIFPLKGIDYSLKDATIPSKGGRGIFGAEATSAPTPSTHIVRQLPENIHIKTQPSDDGKAENHHKITSASFTSAAKNNNSDIDNQGYVLRLFVSSDNAAVEKTLTKIYQLLEEGLVYPYTLKVIDISKNPEQAENYHIAATPTLVRVWPQPIRRIVGQLDDFERVLQIISTV